MTTATVEIKNSIALDMLRYLENIGMLRMLNTKPIAAGQKLSERFAGSLSKESVGEMQKELSSMRNEWEHNKD
jgi:HAMP domain-containing protein